MEQRDRLPSHFGRDPDKVQVVEVQEVLHCRVALPTSLYPVLHEYVMLEAKNTDVELVVPLAGISRFEHGRAGNGKRETFRY